MATKNRSAAELVAFHLCSDIADVRDARYQSSRYASAVFAIGDCYFCAPAKTHPLPHVGYVWEKVGEYYGRFVYRASMDNPIKE
jgi:NADH dehydrogenase FAD-containing subunit